MTREILSSLQNARIKNVVKLRERRHRDRQGLMIIEGYRELRRAIDNQVPIQDIFYCPELYQGENEPRLLQDSLALGARHQPVTANVFRKIAYRDRPEGLLALAPIPKHDFEALKARYPEPKKDLFLLVCESIEKPGNLGTILRSSDAAGVDAVLVCDKVTDVFNPNVVRASLGTLFSKSVFQLSSKEALSWLREHKIPSFAATPAADKRHSDTDMSLPCALVIGSEQYGLSELWMNEADQQIRIPMLGQADSLNAAQAATLLMFEVVRQAGWDSPPQ